MCCTCFLDLFCDIKFVKKIFVRWISCKNEVLCHLASRTLGILFSHSYLTADQFLDLAELLLGVHDEKNNVFGNMEVSYRPNRPGVFFGDVSDSSSSPIDSDYESTPEPDMSSSDESDLLDNSDNKPNKELMLNASSLGSASRASSYNNGENEDKNKGKESSATPIADSVTATTPKDSKDDDGDISMNGNDIKDNIVPPPKNTTKTNGNGSSKPPALNLIKEEEIHQFCIDIFFVFVFLSLHC